MANTHKYVYLFSEGNGSMRELLGGKGANLAEMTNLGMPVPQGDVYKRQIWSSALPSDTPSLRVFMATLRKKIEPDPSHPRYIQTHIGVGYRMIRQPDEEAGAESEA